MPTSKSLPAGAVVGTSSPRRQAQLAALRPDLRYEALRGNVDTRLRKLAAGEYDAIVLAMAGLKRLRAGAPRTSYHLQSNASSRPSDRARSPSKRARTTSGLLSALRAAVNDPASELCVECERAALRTMRAGCSAPLGIHAHLRGEGWSWKAPTRRRRGTASRIESSAVVATLAAGRALGAELAARLQPSNAAPSGVGS